VADETPLRRELVFVVPGRLDQFTGGYLFDRHIVEGLRARGRVVQVIELTGGRRKANAVVLAGVADGTETVVDGLALANLGKVVAAQARRLRLVAFVHGPLAQESGLPPARAKQAGNARLEAGSRYGTGKVVPPESAKALLEAVIRPGDRVCLEGDNQKQADFLAEILAGVDPSRIHDLHIVPAMFPIWRPDQRQFTVTKPSQHRYFG
jgi:hypothetical protein